MDKLFREYAHESGQDDEIGTICRNSLRQAMVEAGAVLMIVMIDDVGLYSGGLRNLQAFRGRRVAYHRGNGSIQPSVEDCLHIASTARDKNDDAFHRHFRRSVSALRQHPG